ncbi:Calmodulin-binding transcription activator 4 [Quillaja saponaria]|uniref:Calmodulin-binding transcription activator 4 n=1 Tax=Quillaja saponaria TaxID=32244 RepID=A0AAD7P7U9_QUISA|nr:Calmodulin-binding transcription activator 4 [Quillaja saponaria]
MQPGYNINELYREAQTRWLKPVEVLSILQNHEKYQISQEPPKQPTSGSLLLFNKRVLRFFRKDGHSWRKKKDGRTVQEAHERLKVGNVEALNCYYAHGEQDPNFQRRSYWMLDPAYEHIVLVHYRQINEGKLSSGPIAQLSPGPSSTFTQSPGSYNTKNPGSTSMFSNLQEPYQNFSSPGSVEVTSDILIKSNGMDQLRKLEEQLSLNEDNFKEIAHFCNELESLHDSNLLQNGTLISKPDNCAASLGPDDQNQCYGGYSGVQGDSGEHHDQFLGHDYTDGNKKAFSWNEVLDSCKTSLVVESPEQYVYGYGGIDKPLSSSRREATADEENNHWLNFCENNDQNAFLLPQEVGSVKFPVYSCITETQETNSDYYALLFNQGQIGIPLEADASLTVAQKQKFTIKEISPEWGYATETTKVIIIGSFLCNPSDSAWTCMFGDVEVPVHIIQEGVIRCEAPPNIPGKVTLCITSGNRESCSEVREFEYRSKTDSCTHYNSLQTEATKTPEELLLLVRFAQMLLSNSSTKTDNFESGTHLTKNLKADDDSWSHLIEALLVGSGTSSSTTNWLLEELLKDKLQQWLSCRSQEKVKEMGCSLSQKDQGIIHMIAGLGFHWALNPILSSGVSINFRDINGWTALHWAARFGREKMVASLIASSASAGAVTDPTSQDPTGETAASIAASGGHKGLAGYLSEVALQSHLSSLTLEESELSKGSAEIEAELAVNSVSKENLSVSKDQLSLKHTLAAVRNAALAAARIQAAFRAHSFRKRRQKEAADSIYNVPGLSLSSKKTFRNPCDCHSAALYIQKNYRGYKRRKEFLALRKKVVKIQAHVRGYQVRKHYKWICWAVGILDKVVLRWRRKGVGLRGFRHETEPVDDSDDEDILKMFRKQKVDVAIAEAVSRVLSMVESTEAREQYHRMLQKYRQAKAELGITSHEAAASTSLGYASKMVDDDIYPYL